MHSRRKLMKASLAAVAFAATNVSAKAAGETTSRINESELPRKLTVLSIRQEDGREAMGVKTTAGVRRVRRERR